MKTRLSLSWLILMVVGLTGLLPSARAFYAPAAQRWLNRDPLMEHGGLNLYAMVGNNPIKFIDPLGLLNADRYEELDEQITRDTPYPVTVCAGPDGTQVVQAADGVQMADDEIALFLPVRPNLFSKGRNVFPTRGLLNSNDYLRFGWSWSGTKSVGRGVFRIGWGKGNHIDLWPPFRLWK